VWILRLDEVGQAVFGDHESATDVDLVHQIVSFHRLAHRIGEVDGRCVVDQDIDASESFNNFIDALLHSLFVSDVALQSQGLAAGLHNIFAGSEDSA
jgi:hypothetical protein